MTLNLKTLFRATSAFLIGGILSACDINQRGLVNDSKALLEKCNVRPTSIKPVTIGWTRRGSVEIPVAPRDVASIISHLNLQETSIQAIRNTTPDVLIDKELNTHFRDKTKIFRSQERPENLRLLNGAAFQYLILLWNEELGTATLVLEYSYG